MLELLLYVSIHLFHPQGAPELYIAKVTSDIHHSSVLTTPAHRQHQHRNIQMYEGESKSKGKIHLTALIEVTVSNFEQWLSVRRTTHT